MKEQLKKFFDFYNHTTKCFYQNNSFNDLVKNLTDQELIDQFCQAIEDKNETKQHLLLGVAVKKVEKQILYFKASTHNHYHNLYDDLFSEFLIQFLRRIGSYSFGKTRGNPLGSNGMNSENKKLGKKNLKAMAIFVLRYLNQTFIKKEAEIEYRDVTFY